MEFVYQVPDVSCEHCVRAISNEVSSIDGVTRVDVNLESKTVRVTASSDVDESAVRASIEEAGYEVAS